MSLESIRQRFGAQRSDAAIARARQFLEENRPTDAVTELDALLADEPDHVEALYLRGTARLEAGHAAQALADLERAAALDPGDPRRHFNLAFAYWSLEDEARCLAALGAALKADPGFARAHDFLAKIALRGPLYLDVIPLIHAHLKPRTYLEIGIDRGIAFSKALPQTLALGVDPEPRVETPLGPRQRVFREASDEFFSRRDVRKELGGLPLDLAFIDGMHWFEYALRDFMHVEPLCTPASTILVHDIYPLDRATAGRERTTAFWTGDVWRLIMLLKKYRPDLSIHTVAAPPSGLAIIRRLDPASRTIAEHLEDLIREYMALDYSVLEEDKAGSLNLCANDWNTIRALLEDQPAQGAAA